MAPSGELAAGGKLEDAVDIAEWLRGLGLEKYAPAFDENAINWDVLSELTTDDLKEIGVAAVGDRRRLLAAIAALDEGAVPAAPAPVRSSAPAESGNRRQEPSAIAERGDADFLQVVCRQLGQHVPIDRGYVEGRRVFREP